ncbi:MAG: ATP-binding protein [Myxococcota bacterium]|nr:ATP-binding protein [Myxococcota bacterium]
MTGTTATADDVGALVEFVRTDRTAILAAWRVRIGSLPAWDGPSLATHGIRVLEWVVTSLEQRGKPDDTSTALPLEESFSAPRAIAELALLTETIDRLKPPTVDNVARDSLHRVIDAAITHSLARDNDESERLRKRLRLATDVTLVGSWELDPVSGVVLVDPRSRELFCVTAEQPPTVDGLTELLHADDRERVRAGIAQTLGSGEPYIDECRTHRPDGAIRWIAIAADAHPSLGAALPNVLGIVHDVTDGKRAEEEHARVVEELSRAVHISEMFVGILGHDLRNPLSAILSGAQLLAADARDEKSARVLSLVLSSGERMGRMIDQLLDFTRARLGEGIPLDRDTVDLAELAAEAVAEGKSSATSCALRLTTSGETVGSWDRDRLAQILSNLVGNAIQHGQAAGNVEVVVDGTKPERVTLSVHNEGLIPLHLVPVIFNPFRGTVQKRGKSKGLGLGLYVARQIALAHGGELSVEPTATGTIFTLTLRRVTPGTPASRQDFVREEELAAFERMAAPPSSSAVTAQLFGATPLAERVPLEHSDIVDRYRALLETALHRKAYRGQGEDLADDLRGLADRLGDLGAGPREVTDVHARALRQAVRGVTAAKTQALLAEGRLLALELMGGLASYYRRRSRGQSRSPGAARP